MRKKLNNEELQAVETLVRDKSIPYEYRTKDYPLEVIRSKFGEESDSSSTLFIPDYQREFVWRPDRQSRFIESVLLGVPLTPFLVSEDENGRLEIIDGSQRIRTLIVFSESALRLRGLKILDRLNGLKYKDLPKKVQSIIDNRDFKVIVVSDKAKERERRDIFDRINTTSEKLSDSEIRKGAYAGVFYNLILDLKRNEVFQRLCQVSEKKRKRGELEELILRFFAFSDRRFEFRHDVAAFLNSYLDDMNVEGFDEVLYRGRFERMILFVARNLPNGFSKHKSTPRVRFEAISLGVHFAMEDNPAILNCSIDWLDSDEFNEVTTSDSSNSPKRLNARIDFVRRKIIESQT